MFLLFPIGHDRSVFGLPRLTLAIIAACTLIHLVAWEVERRALDGAMMAERHALTVLAHHPDACVDFAISGLPDELLALLQAPQCVVGHVLTPADHELIGASRELISHFNRIPTLRMGYRPGRPSVGTLFASMWMHGGFFHLFGNMVFLFLAGSVIESFWGPVRFFVLYIASGIAGTLAHHFMSLGDLTPMVGASGAISGLLGAFVVLYPRTRIQMGYLVWLLVYFRRGAFMMPAWAAIPLWGGQQVFGALYDAEGGVAYGAHLGGMVVGVLGGALAFVLGFGDVPASEEPEATAKPPPRAPALAVPAARPSQAPRGVAPQAPTPGAEDLPLPEFGSLGPMVRPATPRPNAYPDGIPLELDDFPGFDDDGDSTAGA